MKVRIISMASHIKERALAISVEQIGTQRAQGLICMMLRTAWVVQMALPWSGLKLGSLRIGRYQ